MGANGRGRPGTKAGVAAGHDATAEAALTILSGGGNAADAAIAAVFAACIAEPILTGPLGAGLMTFRPAGGRASVLDFFARVPGLGAPTKSTADVDFVGVEIDFGPAAQEFHIGRGAAAVPGTISGMFEAQALWGRLPMSALVAPACALARKGAIVSERMAQMMRFLRPIIVHTAEVRALFAPEGELLKAGDRFLNPNLADTLERLADEGPELVYAGEIAERIVDTFGGQAGLLTREDLAAYRPIVREPLELRHGAASVTLPPSPTAGGPLVAHSLAQLAAAEPIPAAGSLEHMRLLASVMRSTDAARAELVPSPGSTTHVSVVDNDGNAATVTTSNGESCGHVVPGTGILMNNFLGEEDINPGGFHQQTAGEGMITMMCPTVVHEDNGRTTVMGTGGSNRIRTAIFQVVSNLLDHGMSLEQAVLAPRLHLEGSVLNIETSGLDGPTVDTLAREVGELVRFSEGNMFFGGVHAVRTGPSGTEGAGDPRRGGVFRTPG